MNVILVTAGTSGDIFPILQLALALGPHCDRRHVIAPFAAKSIAEFNGIPFSPIASERACDRSDLDLHLLTTRYRELFVSRHAIRGNAHILYLLEKLSDQDTVLVTVARGFLWADICASLHGGQPILRVHIAPPVAMLGFCEKNSLRVVCSVISLNAVSGTGVRWPVAGGCI